jgi:hypothetical protein
MLRWLVRALFLVKEIKSRAGVLHFQRFRLLQTQWFALYVHRISASDEDKDAHDHPWDFITLILKGAYEETWYKSPHWALPMTRRVKSGGYIRHHHSDAHKLKLLTPVVWTLVLTTGHDYSWGYQTREGWVAHDVYRVRKHAPSKLEGDLS